ncbi:uncharacterized protein C8Q71DRAFT_143952 [Rhodofomes roseus]|uniref:Uncharacterized protein n=1 Tax=Rhodofomes roseus TaxID=34475 RepID=A0ABQ8KB22_9APHY|nr:uncharacterized protein C8Q71DRAFT_143952 [Rhodofomes roseus]KAH9834482.1 hypothetical protein C8Q71DRAFT_143952 [Rhodofomes roseus]
MGGRGGASLSTQMGHQHQHRQGMSDGDGAATPTSAHHHKHSHSVCGGCGSGFLMNLLGFDRFTKGKAADGLARAGKAPNPFDLGVLGNCKDFWTKGRELGVEYEQLYDVPPEGFGEAKKRRQHEEGEELHGEGRKGLRKSLLMGFGLSRGGSSRAGYEPLNQV